MSYTVMIVPLPGLFAGGVEIQAMLVGENSTSVGNAGALRALNTP